MSADVDPEDQTEEPTEKRLQDATERGEVAFSREAPLFASLAATLVALIFIIPSRADILLSALVGVIDDPAGWRIERGEDVVALADPVVVAGARFLLPTVNDHAANIADLVNSSTELFFKSGTLRYALSASFTARWDATPIVEIDMEFRHAAVCAFFRLQIDQRRAGVQIIDILFDEQGLDEPAKAERLSVALDGARLRPQ